MKTLIRLALIGARGDSAKKHSDHGLTILDTLMLLLCGKITPFKDNYSINVKCPKF